jgi:hypothetical protein
MNVTLNTEEIALCEWIASLRDWSNKKAGSKEMNIKPECDPKKACSLGVRGEYAFCKLFNIMPDFEIRPRSAKTDEGDCIMPSGEKVDVKTTSHPNGELRAQKWKRLPGMDHKIDLYALMIGEDREFRFVGFMPAYELLQDSRYKEGNYGKVYFARQDELNNDIPAGWKL